MDNPNLPPPEHRHDGWFCCHEQKVAMAERLSEGLCTIVPHPDSARPYASWCLLHNREEDAGHAFDTGRLSTLD